MPTVTGLREDRRGRVAVELDGSPWRTLPADVVVRAGSPAGGPSTGRRFGGSGGSFAEPKRWQSPAGRYGHATSRPESSRCDWSGGLSARAQRKSLSQP